MADPLNAPTNAFCPSSVHSKDDAYDDDFSNISAKSMNAQLNDLFRQRLEYLQLTNPNDLQITLLVYQEWVDALLRSTQIAIKHKEAIEEKILKKLKPFHHIITTDANEVSDQCQKCRWDIDKLVKFIQRAFHNNDWDMAELKCNSKLTFRNP